MLWKCPKGTVLPPLEGYFKQHDAMSTGKQTTVAVFATENMDKWLRWYWEIEYIVLLGSAGAILEIDRLPRTIKQREYSSHEHRWPQRSHQSRANGILEQRAGQVQERRIKIINAYNTRLKTRRRDLVLSQRARCFSCPSQVPQEIV